MENRKTVQRMIIVDASQTTWIAMQDITDGFDMLGVEWRMYMSLDAGKYFFVYQM